MPVEDLVGLSVQAPVTVVAVALPGLDAARAAATRPVAAVVAGQAERGGEALAGDGERRGQGARRDAGQQFGTLRLGAEGEDERGGERRGGEERGGSQGAARLLAGQGEFGGGAADPAVSLGERQAGQAEFAAEGRPQGRVVAAWGWRRRP